MAGWTFSHLGEKIWRVLCQLANMLSRETRPDSDCRIVDCPILGARDGRQVIVYLATRI